MTIDHLAEETRALCCARLAAPDLRVIAERLSQTLATPDSVWRLLSGVAELPQAQATVRRTKDTLIGVGGVPDDGTLERYLLLRAAVQACAQLPLLPVTSRVKQRFCAEFEYLTTADLPAMGKILVGSSRFAEFAKTTTLRRFPAGQFDWEVSGVPRSALLRVGRRHLAGVAGFLVWRMRGLGPVFFSHLNPRRPERGLLEIEANRSYYQMAKTMELQPHIRGFAAWSWFRSPATHAVSPQLAWLSRVFVEHGGLVVEAGPEPTDGGVLYRSATRRRLYDAGQFRPTRGLVLWPRRAMLRWAAAHPEFEALLDVTKP